MKRYLCLFLILISSIISASELNHRHAISYQGGDRFGDRLLVYAQARYLSYISSTPFLYRPFVYSNLITADFDSDNYDTQKDSYQQVLTINSFDTLNQFFQILNDPWSPSTLFIVDYLPTDITEWDQDTSRKLLFNIAWDEEGFHEYLNHSICPLIAVPDFRKEGVLNVADHVRTLSGNDTPDTSFQFLPLKHPNLDYHKSQVRRVYALNQQRPMHVFIFSDTKDPQRLVEDFRNSFIGYNIEFGIQFLDNPDTNYAVQDFFAMQKFEVLIATQSNFSMMASRLASHEMVITPIKIKGSYPHTAVDRIQLVSKKSSWFPYDLNITIKE